MSNGLSSNHPPYDVTMTPAEDNQSAMSSEQTSQSDAGKVKVEVDNGATERPAPLKENGVVAMETDSGVNGRDLPSLEIKKEAVEKTSAGDVHVKENGDRFSLKVKEENITAEENVAETVPREENTTNGEMAEENCPNEELSANGGDKSNEKVDQEINTNGNTIPGDKNGGGEVEMAEENNTTNEEMSANDESNKEVEQETNKNGKVISDEKVSLIIEESNMNGESENNISKESQNNARKEAEINTNSDLDLNLNGDDSFGDLQIVEFDEDVKPETFDASQEITEAADASQETANQNEAIIENTETVKVANQRQGSFATTNENEVDHTENNDIVPFVPRERRSATIRNAQNQKPAIKSAPKQEKVLPKIAPKKWKKSDYIHGFGDLADFEFSAEVFPRLAEVVCFISNLKNKKDDNIYFLT